MLARVSLLTPATRAGDDGGVVKYWQPNMNNVKATQAHKEPVSDCSRGPCVRACCSRRPPTGPGAGVFVHGPQVLLLLR